MMGGTMGMGGMGIWAAWPGGFDPSRFDGNGQPMHATKTNYGERAAQSALWCAGSPRNAPSEAHQRKVVSARSVRNRAPRLRYSGAGWGRCRTVKSSSNATASWTVAAQFVGFRLPRPCALAKRLARAWGVWGVGWGRGGGGVWGGGGGDGGIVGF